MGVSSIRDLAVIEQSTLDDYENEVLAVDAHHWLFRYSTVQVRYRSESQYTTSDGTEVPNLLGLLRGLPTFWKAGVKPVFVFDGKPESLKADEIADRRESKKEAKELMEEARKQGDVEAARRYKAQTQSLTPTVHETSRELLDLLGVPYVEADGAGEGYAARLAADDDSPVSAVYSGDYDSILFGSPDTVRPRSGGDHERIQLQETLDDLGLTYEQLVDVAILIGMDYNEGVRGIGPARGVKYVTGGRDAVEIVSDRDADSLTEERIETIREIFQTPPTGESLMMADVDGPDFSAAEEFLVDEWEIPRGTVQENFDRFPMF